MKRYAVFLAALLLLIPAGPADFVNSRTLFVNSAIYAQIVLDDVVITPDQIVTGSTADFSVTFENTGSGSTMATAHVYIFNAANTLVDSFNYGSVGLVPNQKITQQKTWATGSLPIGAYTAKANVTYDPGNSTNGVSNELSKSFAIISGGGGGGGGPEPDTGQHIIPIPTGEIPPVTPVSGGPVDFTRFPVLREVLAGQASVQGFSFVNKKNQDENITLSYSGVNPDWLRRSSEQTLVLAGETRNVDLSLSVPADAQPGDYLVRVDAKNKEGTSSDFMVLRVKGASPLRTQPIVLRAIDVDRVERNTTVRLTLTNPGAVDLKRMLLVDSLPPELEAKDVAFLDKPGEVKVQGGRKTVRWDVPELLSKEQTTVSYALSGVLGEYSPYANSYAYELEITQRTDLSNVVSIMDLSANEVAPGGKTQVVATVLYVGLDPLPVTMTLDVPAGFITDPTYTVVTLLPRSTFTSRFDVTAPENAQDSQLVRFLLYTEDGQVSARLPLIVSRTGTSAPSSAAALSITPSDAAMVGMLALALMVGYLVYRRKSEGGGSRFDKERLDYAKSIARTVKVSGAPANRREE